MKDQDPQTPKSNKQVPKVQKFSESEQSCLKTIKMDSNSPIQDFLCLDEHEKIFENLWKKESGI